MLEQLDKDKKVLIGCMASSFIFYHVSTKFYCRGAEIYDAFHRCHGGFITARQKPRLVHVECHVEDGILTIAAPGKPKVSVDLRKVVENGKLIRASLFDNLKQDGYDCGDEVAQVLSEYIEEPDYRLIFYKEGLYTERTCIPDDDWWNTPVPKRKDDSGFTDLAPFLLATEASVNALNENLDKK
uniref:MOSC_N domain-containing protein n=1 Tax=Caenorhabditis japonica TaxID=281687 RepID=A0A8R1IIM9_CAEJA